MTKEIMDWALYKSRSTRGARLALAAMAAQASNDGLVEMSVSELGRLIAMSWPAAKAAVRRLVKCGDLVVDVEPKLRQAGLYRFGCFDGRGGMELGRQTWRTA